MPVDLTELAAPAHSAVLTMELQRGVCGDLSPLPALADAVAEDGVVASTARLLDAARAAGVAVVHCTAETRPDRKGSMTNAPMLSAMSKGKGGLLVGSDAAQVIPELGPADGDLVSPRLHGLSPFIGTELDSMLRSLDVRTVVATGVSVNLGVLGLCIEAVNLGYRVVVATDCVTGVPASYVADVLQHTLALVATRVTSAQLLEAWGQRGA